MQGYFKNDLAHGKVNVAYSDGAIFKGNFFKGEKNGKGSFLFPNGDKYIGNFKKNQFQGKGIYLLNETQQTFKGIWKMNMLINPVVVQSHYYKYFGEVKNFTLNGQGKMFMNNYVYKGTWCMNEMHGLIFRKNLKEK